MAGGALGSGTGRRGGERAGGTNARGMPEGRTPAAAPARGGRAGAGAAGVFAQATFFLALRAGADAELQAECGRLRAAVEGAGGRVLQKLDGSTVRRTCAAPRARAGVHQCVFARHHCVRPRARERESLWRGPAAACGVVPDARARRCVWRCDA